jgi:hypothetical protein
MTCGRGAPCAGSHTRRGDRVCGDAAKARRPYDTAACRHCCRQAEWPQGHALPRQGRGSCGRHAPGASQILGRRPFPNRLRRQVVDHHAAFDGVEAQRPPASRAQIEDGSTASSGGLRPLPRLALPAGASGVAVCAVGCGAPTAREAASGGGAAMHASTSPPRTVLPAHHIVRDKAFPHLPRARCCSASAPAGALPPRTAARVIWRGWLTLAWLSAFFEKMPLDQWVRHCSPTLLTH